MAYKVPEGQRGLIPGPARELVEAGVNDAELRSVMFYTGHGSELLNFSKGLRRVEPATEELADNLSAYIDKMPGVGGDVYRGERTLANAQARWPVGEIVTQGRFTSTSFDPENAGKFGKVRLVIDANGQGAEIVASHFQGEEEVLFKPGTRFKVEKHQGQDIHLKALPDQP